MPDCPGGVDTGSPDASEVSMLTVNCTSLVRGLVNSWDDNLDNLSLLCFTTQWRYLQPLAVLMFTAVQNSSEAGRRGMTIFTG